MNELDNRVDILLNVDVGDAVKAVAELREENKRLREEQQNVERTTEAGKKRFAEYSAEVKVNNRTIQQYERQLVNTITQQKVQEGSIRQLRAQLTNLKTAYAEMSAVEREGAKGKELLNKTAGLNAQLKELEGAYGDNQRKVGEYELAGRGLSKELADLTDKLRDLAAAGLQNSDTYRELRDRAIDLKNAQNEVDQTLNASVKAAAEIEGVIQTAQAVTAAYGTWKATAAALGIENEALEETMRKMVVVMGALQSLTVLQNVAQRQSNSYLLASNLLRKIGIKQTATDTLTRSAYVATIRAEAAAENASTAAKVKGAVVTKLLTAAQWLWNAAITANPVMLLVVAIAALIGGITALVKWMGRESQEARAARLAQEAYNVALEDSERRLKLVENAHKNNVRALQLSTRETVESLRRTGAAEQAIRDAEIKGQTQIRDLEIETHRQRIAETEMLLKLKNAERDALWDVREASRGNAKQWKKYTEQIRETESALTELRATLDDNNYSLRETMQDQIEADRQAVESAKERAKAEREAAASALAASIAKYEAELDAQKKYIEAFVKAEADFQSDDLRTKQRYARRIFDLNAGVERARLDNLRANNKLTEKEYQRSLDVMAAELTAFNNVQVRELETYYASERKAITALLTATLDEQITDIEKKYAEALKKLGDLGEDAGIEQVETAVRLEDEKNAEIARLRASYLSDQIKKIEEQNNAAFADDLARFENNERKRLEILETSLQSQIDAKKTAGATTFADESQLEQVRAQRIAANLNAELLLAEDNARKTYDAKVKALTAERELYADNADKQLEVARALADAERALIEQRVADFTKWRDAASDLFNSFSDFLGAGLSRQLQEVQAAYDKESLALANKHAVGTLSEAEYNREVIKMQQKRAKDEAKIERERAIKERAGKVFSVVTDTAVGVAKAVASSPLTFGLPWSAFVSAVGALNLATILSEPLPKARRGGLIEGPTHAFGGVPIEAEGGEAIINRRSVSLFGPLLSALNELGGGVPFARPLSDGGYTLRASGSPGASADEIAAAFKNVTIVTTVEDINREQAKMTQIESRGSVFSS